MWSTEISVIEIRDSVVSTAKQNGAVRLARQFLSFKIILLVCIILILSLSFKQRNN